MKRYTYAIGAVLTLLLPVGWCWENGAGIVIAEEPKGQAAAHANQAKGNGVDGVFGKLSTLDRQGKPWELKLAPDGVERSYIEGGTLATAIWTFKGVTEDKFPGRLLGEPERPVPAGLLLEMNFKAFRGPYRPLRRGAIISIAVKNPKTGTRSEVWLGELLQDGRSPTHVAHIPRRRASVPPESLPRRIVGPQREFDFFRDFVAEGSVEILVRSAERGVFLGMREQDLRLIYRRKRPPPGRTPPKATDKTVLGKRERPGAPGKPYARAIAACRGTWPEYEGAIFEFTEGHAKRQGIFLEDEVRIADELHAVLKQCLAEMQPKLQEANDGKTWFQAAIIHSLLGQDADALGYFFKAAKLDQSYRGVYHFFRGKQRYANSELVKAYNDLSEAIRLDPDNASAYALRARMADLMDQPKDRERDRERARRLDPKVDSPRRTLPRRTVYPLHESLRELGKPIPKKLTGEPF